jgi:L-seryl-tRNA(Ser) seleniumtransferase
MTMSSEHYAKIPSVQEIDRSLAEANLNGGKEVRHQIQALLNEIRQNSSWLAEAQTTRESILAWIQMRLMQDRQRLMPVINGTGAIIHTNLGRSVYSRELFLEVTDIATAYTNLEFSLETGKRGTRLSNVGNLLKTLTGAEEAVVVNNNAAAVLLTLTALAAGREVIISRGELIEIGGSFRIPDIIGVSGAVMREVGTTNRTRLPDYENAINDQTAVLLKAHTSNFRILGFTESVPTPELAVLARKTNKILVEDLGSGALIGFDHGPLNTEPLVPQVLKDGIDIVTFSGDKLLGGPQAGIILGKSRYLERIRRHPLYRALRCDKLTMLLLERTLVAYSQNAGKQLIPTQRMLNEQPSEVRTRAEMIIAGLDPNAFRLIECQSTPGGGSLPGAAIPSWGIEITRPGWSENRLLDHLRHQNPPVIGRIQDGAVIIDCRTVLPHQVSLLQTALARFET